jgi:hypothetical protein
MKVATVNKTLAEFANEDLRHDYENDDMTLKEMELKYDMTRQSIHNRAKKFGWKKLSKIKKITQATVNNFIEIDRLHDSVPALETMSPDVVKHKLSKALQIINDLQDVQNTALYVNKFIINKLVFDLENNIINYDDASKILQRLGASIDKIASFYKEPAQIQTNIQINNKQEEQAPVINIVAS